jgi:hypothetical protein
MKKFNKTIVVLIVAMLLCMIFGSCQEDPLGVPAIDYSLPEITKIESGVDKLLAGGETDVTTEAKQGNSYQWSADHGTFADASSASTTWSSEGITENTPVKLKCTVSNGSGSRFATITVQVVVKTEPTYHWPLDNNLTDIVAGNNGTGSAVTFNTDDPKIGAACLEVFGNQNEDEIMTIADAAAPTVKLGPEDDFSLSYWMKTAEDVGVIWGRQEAPDAWDWDYSKSTFYEEGMFLIYRGNGWRWIDGEGPELNDEEWHFITVAHFGADDSYQLFVDGESIAAGGLAYDTQTSPDEGTNFYFGGVWGDDDFTAPFIGTLDELKYYDSVLPEAEVALLAEE